MATVQQKTADRLAAIAAELKGICDRPIADGQSKLEAEVSSLEQVSPSQRTLEQLAAKEVTPHEKMFLHLADEQITDAEALLAFRHQLQDIHYSDYADTLSVLTLLSDLSDTRFAFLQHWEQREQEGGRFLNVEKEWMDYRLFHAKAHSERIRQELIDAQEHRLVPFHPEDVSG
jgi:hypothetical protein